MSKGDLIMKPYRILCVCLGNICRSPTAEAVLRTYIKNQGLNIEVDSAGTSNYHPNASPDLRSQKYAKKRGYDLSQFKARQVNSSDFRQFDLILAMDLDNLNQLQKLKNNMMRHQAIDSLAELALMTAQDSTQLNRPIADPYYGAGDGFELVLEQCESATQAWLSYFKSKKIG